MSQEYPLFHASLSPTVLADFYRKFQQDRNAVDPQLAAFFDGLGAEAATLFLEEQGPTWGCSREIDHGIQDDLLEALGINETEESVAPVEKTLETGAVASHAVATTTADHAGLNASSDLGLKTQKLIHSYRTWGHLQARLDPLGLAPPVSQEELNPAACGLSDLRMTVPTHGFGGRSSATVESLLGDLTKTYCEHIGIEYMHLQDGAERLWVQDYMEQKPLENAFESQDKTRIFQKLHEAEMFERFLQKKYPGAKRFGLEGAETSMVFLHQMIMHGATQYDAAEVVLGMAHRGRLNVLCNLLQKKPRIVFKEFTGESLLPEEGYGSGDVKYHLGASADLAYGDKKVHLSLCPNPSHLEAVNTVVLGRLRAKQEQLEDADQQKAYGIIIHGDAAFAGQGIVSETLLLSQLKGYSVGGSIHLIVNNQIGFTTNPRDSRSTHYCSELAKSIQAPVIHVNGDDPEAVAYAAQLAIDYRYRFKRDVVIDLFCYRRHGHNEMDEPAFTQPQMYAKIKKHPSAAVQYQEALEAAAVLKDGDAVTFAEKFNKEYQAEFEASKAYKANKGDWLEGQWKGFKPQMPLEQAKTGVAEKTLKQLGVALTTTPEGFSLHPTLQRQLKDKATRFEAGQGIDWATAEALAFGSLMLEGHGVRLSGQDVGRGTFSQRHAKWIDQKTSDVYSPLAHLSKKQGPLQVVESPLSEMGVLGFEYGYSTTEPSALVLWEAQFGDFANGAQVIMDQFISCAQAKWLRLSGLVMLLPHGYEGQGPEHSSARFERYLQLCAMDNMIVANCTTPANYFHILRRQLCQKSRKPLIIMTPKSLLRHKQAISSLDDMSTGSVFRPVLPEQSRNVVENTKVRRIVLCTGKVYYDLLQKREQLEIKDVVILRAEQLYPFPAEDLTREVSKYRHAQVVWCQEEPMNMGAWTFVERRLERLLTDMSHQFKRPAFVVRTESPSPATGFAAQHALEQESLVEKALVIAR
ncbi:2-oxoglutarate dehydrogenase E1 component [Alphaproteobacteria bacterium]|nr:2-oxoglutarate dehydrogenase E1 component [Alphaproteobacteria bacterium]